MSAEYNNYILNHKSTVYMAASWFIRDGQKTSKLIDILPKFEKFKAFSLVSNHDASKYSDEEYSAYDNFFYGEKTQEVIENFNKAWLHHIHCNPHHWQYWVLINDDEDFKVSGQKFKVIEMPDNYIFEMICDWWSFSWKEYTENLKGNNNDDKNDKNEPVKSLYSIFDWYRDHEGKMLLGYDTRSKVESILKMIKTELDVYGYSPDTSSMSFDPIDVQ